MVCYGGGHMKIIEPLYFHFTTKGHQVDILALTTAAPYFESKGIDFFTFSDFPSLYNEKARKYGEELINGLEFNSLPRSLSLSYLGVSFYDLVKTIGEQAAREKYDALGRRAFLPVKALSQIISERKTELIITTNSPRSERAALIAAKNLNLPSLCINDFLAIKGGALDIAEAKLGNKICVLTQSVKEELISNSDYPADNIVVTGSPVFDKLKKQKRKLSSNKPVILLADYNIPTQHPHFNAEYGDPLYSHKIRSECARLGKLHNWKFIFRPHPNQKIDYDEHKCDQIIISNAQDDLHEILSYTDIVITAVSTVGLEGLIAGTKLISIENTVFSTTGFSYKKSNLSIGINNATELESAIQVALNQEDVRLSLYEGLASENIEREANSLLKTY